jgi:hypothetical protein
MSAVCTIVAKRKTQSALIDRLKRETRVRFHRPMTGPRRE